MLIAFRFFSKIPLDEQVTRTQNASTHAHIFKTRMAKYYPDIAKGAKGTFFLRAFVLFLARRFPRTRKRCDRSSPLSLEGGSRRGVSPFFLSTFSSTKNRFIHRRVVLRKQILLGRETNLRRGTFSTSIRSPRFCRESLFYARRSFVRRFIVVGGERSKNRKIFARQSKALKEEKRTKRANIFSRAHSFSLFQSVINTHTHTHIKI